MPIICLSCAFVALGQGVKKCFGQIKNKATDKKIKQCQNNGSSWGKGIGIITFYLRFLVR